MKVLITRTDRLGDLVLSLPIFTGLKTIYPDWEIHAMVAPVAVPLVESDPGIAQVWTWSDDMPETEAKALGEQLRAADFDAVVMLQYRRQLASIMREAGIAKRYGPWSKWTSWFQLNRGLRQNRSAGGCHEMDFNTQLGQRLLRDQPDAGATIVWPQPRIYLDSGQHEATRNFLAEYSTPTARNVFIHPGSGGSALDWEPARFAAVANSLADDAGNRVFVTGAGPDAAVIAQVAPDLNPAVTVLLDQFDLRGFLAVLAAGHLLIGPSTGPLHLAAGLGIATLGLFPPVRTMHPDRWGPRSFAHAAPRNIVPDLDCPARRLCGLESCQHYNCLTEIRVSAVLAAAREILDQAP